MEALANVLTPALVGAAGVHYVVSELSRRGLIALPTVRNVAAFDIVVSTRDGRKHANIQVKTSLKRVTFFPMPPSKRIYGAKQTSGANLTLGSRALALNPAKNRHCRRTQAYDFRH